MVKFTKVYNPVDPYTFSATPQGMLEAFLDRCGLTAESSPFVVGGDTPPALGSGPWFKGGTQLYVDNGSAYVPVDTTNSIVPQVFMGDADPDPTVYQLWLKTAPDTLVGLYYYAGATLGWLSRGQEVLPLSITTAKLANASVTTVKLEDASVREGNIAGNIPVSKWERGLANQFLRMNLAATIPEWDSTHVVSPNVALSTAAIVEYVHNLDETPHMVTAKLVCITAEAGWVTDDEVPYPGFYTSSGTLNPTIFKSPTRVFTRFVTNVSVAHKNTNVNTAITLGNWAIKFYITVA